MKQNYQLLRLKNLDHLATQIAPLRPVQRPSQGWLRIVREALGLPLRSVAAKLKVTPQTVHAFERREAAGTLTLANLRKVAGAMNCEVVYFVVPKGAKTKTFTQLAAAQSGFLADLLATEQSMQLEDQGVGGIDERLQTAARTGELRQ
jgi:predicted DNA-binding mobile mystery protein A